LSIDHQYKYSVVLILFADATMDTGYKGILAIKG
jgi:hypothetical protein